MPEVTKPSPYDEPNMRSAWKKGLKTSQEEKPPPDKHLFDDRGRCLEGDPSAQDREGEP
jgi:hypothetical protein